IRITTDQVRARVIAEGGNLAITQAARIRYSRRGGRINTDFIDNAAGVATSDREVNLKILLALAIHRGRLDRGDRDALLVSLSDDVGQEVLRQVDHSVAALSRAVPASARDLEAYEALLEGLEQRGRLDRQVESLPAAGEMESRHGAGAGLIRPELAVLLAYTKSDLVAAIEASSLIADPAFAPAVEGYFPATVRERFRDLLVDHRLYPQLLATDVAGEIVDQMGIVWAHETATEIGRDLGDVVGAYWAARGVLGADEAWAEVEALGPTIDADAEAELHRRIVTAVGYLARCYLTRSGPIDVAGIIAADRPVVAAITASDHPLAGRDEVEAALVGAGVPSVVVGRFATTAALARIADVGRLSQESGWAPEDVLAAATSWDHLTGLDRLDARLRALEVNGRWASWQVRALRDDMTSLRRQAVTSIVHSNEAVTTWVAARSTGLAAFGRLVDAFETAGADGLLVAGLALRSLARLL
nr:NAD-glutamate dehydrogenase [Actinomycetota bacterium]